jgi:hypothetical protein
VWRSASGFNLFAPAYVRKAGRLAGLPAYHVTLALVLCRSLRSSRGSGLAAQAGISVNRRTPEPSYQNSHWTDYEVDGSEERENWTRDRLEDRKPGVRRECHDTGWNAGSGTDQHHRLGMRSPHQPAAGDSAEKDEWQEQ